MKSKLFFCLLLVSSVLALLGATTNLPGVKPVTGSGSGANTTPPAVIPPSSSQQRYNTNYVLLDGSGRVVNPGFWESNHVARTESFTFVSGGDVHSGFVTGSGFDPEHGREWYSNTVNWVIANKSALNIKAYFLMGDVADSGGDSGGPGMGTNYVYVTNQLWRIRNAGIPVIACAGNHEGNAWISSGNNSDTNWDSYMGPLLKQPGVLVSTSSWGGYRQAAYAVTNNGLKFLFVTTDLYATNRNEWLLENSVLYPDHRVIAINHWDLGSHGNLLNESSYDRAIVDTIPNLIQIHSGHQRDSFAWDHRKEHLENGAVVTHVFFNTQSLTNAGANLVRTYQYYPGENRVWAHTYDTANAHYLTNGQPALPGSLSSNGYFATFSFPIVDSEVNPQYMWVYGVRRKLQGEYTGAGNWNGTLTKFPRFDSYFGFEGWKPGQTSPNAWIFGRHFNDESLYLGYMDEADEGSPSGVATNVVFLPDGTVKAKRFEPLSGGSITESTIDLNQIYFVGSGAVFSVPTNVTAGNFLPPGWALIDDYDKSTNCIDYVAFVPPAVPSTDPSVTFLLGGDDSTAGNAVFEVSLCKMDSLSAIGTAVFDSTLRFTNSLAFTGSGPRPVIHTFTATGWGALIASHTNKIIRVRIARDGDETDDVLNMNTTGSRPDGVVVTQGILRW